MKRARIGIVVWLALGAVAPAAARGQVQLDEVRGVLRVTGDEAMIEGAGRIRLIGVPPQRAVALEPLLVRTADNVRYLDGRQVRATGQLQGDVLWNARVEAEAGEEPLLVVPEPGPRAGFEELTGVLQVTGSEASIDGRVRLIGVPPQRAVAIKPLLAQTAETVRALDGKRVHATGQLQGDILWNAAVGEAPEEDAEEEVEQEVQEETEEVDDQEIDEGLEVEPEPGEE